MQERGVLYNHLKIYAMKMSVFRCTTLGLVRLEKIRIVRARTGLEMVPLCSAEDFL